MSLFYLLARQKRQTVYCVRLEFKLDRYGVYETGKTIGLNPPPSICSTVFSPP